ncbi:unnamed protein product [Protopolystoma xenopodis]|uniref:Uncharacterized protein n=1 Tax=Protopolystoma xenopodis TaxID=117903 RepID=A0A3S5BQ40_9PLAT|nr:unnamed protein product [Protopolystoma xenopodis]
MYDFKPLIIENPETGRLFKQVVEHYHKEVEAYERLLNSAEALASRKTILAQFWKQEGTKRLNELDTSKRLFELQLTELKQRADHLERKNQENKIKRDQLRSDEVKFLKWRAEQLKVTTNILSILSQIDTSVVVPRN